VEIVGGVVVVALLVLGLIALARLPGRASVKMREAAADAARVMRFERVTPPSRAAAANALAIDEDRIVQDPDLFAGKLDGMEMFLGALVHKSKTSVNGAAIPIVVARVVARPPAPLPFALHVSRRVVGMPKSDVELGTAFDKKCVVETDAPEQAKRLLSSTELQEALAAFIAHGQGSAFVTNTHLETPVFYRDPARIRAAMRETGQLGRLLQRARGAGTD